MYVCMVDCDMMMLMMVMVCGIGNVMNMWCGVMMVVYMYEGCMVEWCDDVCVVLNVVMVLV